MSGIYHEFHLFEQVFPQQAVVMAQQQFSRGADALDHGPGTACRRGEAERAAPAQSVHAFAVVALQGFGGALFELRVAGFEPFAEGFGALRGGRTCGPRRRPSTRGSEAPGRIASG